MISVERLIAACVGYIEVEICNVAVNIKSDKIKHQKVTLKYNL